MSFNTKVATVFGGTGFVGTQVVRELAKHGVIVKVATRVLESAYFLRPAGVVGQVVPVACTYDEASIARAVAGSDFVVNCIGILHEKKKGAFQKIHAELPGIIAKACASNKVKRFVHISALGLDGKSRYAQTKRAGEGGVFKNFSKATILRPSVIFGDDDNFFNMFAGLARVAPMLPLIGGGKTKFQPVFVGDVADAVMVALDINRDDVTGQVYELGGPEILTFKEVYQRLFTYTGLKRKLVNLPWGIAKIEAGFLSLLPNPPLTPDQVESLKTDVVVAAGAQGLKDLGVQATSLELVLPRYLARYRSGGRFAEIKSA